MQTQCPNCGGYKTQKIRSYFVDPITYKRRRLYTPLGCLIPVAIVLFGGFLLWTIIPPSAVDQSTQSQSSGPAFAIAFGVALLVWFYAIVWRRDKLKRTALRINHYECLMCGKKFEDH